MPWKPVRVRPVTLDDLPALLELGDELREQVLPTDAAPARSGPSNGPRNGRTNSRAALTQRYTDAIVDPDRHLVLAVGGPDGGAEEPLGMALFTIATANALLDIPAVHISHAVVSHRHRKRGAGKALIAAAAAFADERGIEQLVISVHPGSREAARFFARLGFAPLAMRRTAPVSLVRRRLAQGDRGVEHLVRHRPRRPIRQVLPRVEVDPAD